MKKITLLFLGLLMLSSVVNSQVSINNDGSNADPSAMLDVQSTNLGLLLPRMTEAQRNAINSPATGLIVYCTDCSEMQIYDGFGWTDFYGNDVLAVIHSVTNIITGETWMDHNLGATQIATSAIDAAAYGDLYQWGRLADGHEDRGSGITTTLSSTDNPGHSNMIVLNSSPFDWRSPQNTSLWLGDAGTNNPCPDAYRLPTEAEWNTERSSWASNNAVGAFGSALKLTMAGWRHHYTAIQTNLGSGARYWSSTVNGNGSDALGFDAASAFVSAGVHAYAFSVRCIKD